MRVNKFRFLTALAVAAAFSSSNPRRAWRRAREAWWLIWGMLDAGDRVSGGCHDARMTTCQSCPLFYARLGTCGSPLKDELRDLGCWCHMDFKAWSKDARCWLDQHARSENGEPDPHGWEAHGCDKVPARQQRE